MLPIREPDKQPTTLEQLKCTEEFYPGLVQNIREIKKELGLLDQGDGGDDVVLRLENSQEKENVPDYMDSSPPPPNLVDSSDVESNAGSIDSVTRNADFIAF